MSVINTNIASLNAQRNLRTSQGDLNTSIQRLSSGLRVNSAKDDAAGLAIGTRLDTQSRGMSVAIRNANDGISMLQIADGALSTVSNQLQRMSELAVQANSETNGASDIANLNAEYSILHSEVSKVISGATFNGQSALGGTKTIQVGTGNTANDSRDIGMTAPAITASATIDATTAGAAIAALKTDLDTITTSRATLGAQLNQFDSIISDLSTKRENHDAARSRIMDTDFAAETAKMTRNQILQQAGTAMLAQANQLPNGVMALLRG